jgi:hypothetical protein
MLDVNELLDDVHAHIEAAGLECSLKRETSPLADADAAIVLRWGASRQRFAVHVMESVRMQHVLAVRAERSGLVVAPWISRPMGQKLSDAGVAWADGAGNMAIRFGLVVLEITGRPRPARPASLLTPANSRVLEALVTNPSLGEASLRELAGAAGVSLGQAHKAASLLADAGYHRDRLDPEQLEALSDLLRVGQSRP